MKSEWKVQSNYINGKVMCIPYRKKNQNEPLHSGNIEYYGEYLPTYKEAEKLVDYLNFLEEGKRERRLKGE